MTEKSFRNSTDLKQKQYFSSYQEFDQFMTEIDQELKDIPIVSRQLQGMGEVASRLNTNIYAVSKNFAKQDDFSNPSLSAHVTIWFDKQYGERLKVNFSNMQTICRVSGDLYKVNVPLVIGQPKFVFTGTVEKIDGAINLGSLIEGITHEKLSRITPEEISYLGLRTEIGCLLGHRLFFTDKHVFKDALADFKTSVDMLVLDRPLYGQSRWACLQFIEKTIKAYLATHDISYAFTHDLLKLGRLVDDIEIDEDLLRVIQCSASMRYDSDTSNEDECIKSHEAAQEVALAIVLGW